MRRPKNPYLPDGRQKGPATGPRDLRNRLLELRRDVMQAMQRDGAEPGELAYLAAVHTAIAALDAEADGIAEPGDRAVVTDDGERIVVTVYSADKRAAAATLSPGVAVWLANRLITAALPRLGR